MRARHLLIAPAISATLLLSGCGILNAQPQGEVAPTVQAAQTVTSVTWLPETFDTERTWSTATDANSPLAAGTSGIAYLLEGAITVRGSSAGEFVWSSDKVEGVPELHYASTAGKEYLLAIYGNGTANARIESYLTTRSGEGIKPATIKTFSGGPDKVSIKLSGAGALVSIGARREAYRPDGTVKDVDAMSVALVNDSVLTVGDNGSFGMKSVSGAKVWTSDTLKLPGAVEGANGKFLSESQGLVMASWPTKDGANLLALVRAIDGGIAATIPVKAVPVSGTLLVSSDGRWVTYAGYALNAASGAHYTLPEGVSGVLVDRAVVYASDAAAGGYDVIGKKKISTPRGGPRIVSQNGLGVFYSDAEITVSHMNSLGANTTG